MTRDTPGTEPQMLICRLDHNHGRYVRLNWEVPSTGQDWRYDVSKEKLARCSQRIRDVLLPEVERLSGDGITDSLETALRDLAAEGANLTATALAAQEIAEKRTAAQGFVEFFRSEVVATQRGSWRIIMIHLNLDETGHVVPWGLAMALREDEHIADLPLTDDGFGGFWSAAFNVVSVGGLFDATAKASTEIRVGDITTVAILEIGPDRVRQFREDHSWDERHEQALITSPDHLLDEAIRGNNRHLFSYIALDADSRGSYDLDDDPIIDDRSLSKAHSVLRENVFAITTLDGDCVIRGDRGVKWIRAILNNNRRGIIACETDIRSFDHRYFGWTFMSELLMSSLPFEDAIAETRRKFWPRSLLYGIYCNPLSLYVRPPAEQIKEYLDTITDIISLQKRAAKNAA